MNNHYGMSTTVAIPGILQNVTPIVFYNSTVKTDIMDYNFKRGSSVTTSGTKKRIKILLVGKARYGSTFLGQFINYHPEILYIFEPIRTIHFMAKFGAIPESLIDAGAVEILRSLYNCEFPSYFIHHNIRNWKLGVYNSRVIRLFCGGVTECSSRDLDEFPDLCALYEYLAIKVIRLTSLGLLEPIITKDKHDLKVIFLVRDPRGVASSRRTMKFPPRQRNESLVNLKLVGEPGSDPKDLHKENINYDCHWLRENLNIIEKPPDWLKGRVMFLRHEDVAMNTGKVVDGIYDFLRIEKHKDIGDLIETFTKSVDSQTDNNMETRRNSTDVVHSWRKNTSFTDVLAIQDVCDDVMERLGYRLIKSEDELTNIEQFQIF
ncbi:carbohydrate sulfotransferase 1-like [Glandiceps talaboti]